ncbi:MAG TPA: ABC-F family ATP-binding cassette domain-containing protein [Candidatus Saccharimonadales bacterium]|jgi:ATPase subunit of ABC transporter with duplicated ATPase domains
MLLSVAIGEKSFGDKVLYQGLQFSVQENEKVGLIGRNGTGKSTLFNIIAGDDLDYDGEIILKRGSILVASRQEHHGHEAKTVLEYIQGDLPDYQKLAYILDTYPESMGDSTRKMQEYSDALERFSDLGYYQLEDEIEQAFELYQIDKTKLHSELGSLSGGQKRMVELMKVQRSRGHIALIDEPTNHMDYIAKEAFVKWLKAAQEAVVVITHDRDVLRSVDRIIEVRDGAAYAFRGNYDDYLRTNKSQVTSQVNEYDITQKRIRNLQEDVIRFQRLKEKSRDPGTIRRFKSQEQKARDDLRDLQSLEKPSFWIDQESASSMNDKMSASYEKYKAQNIRIRTATKESASHRLLIQADKLSLGYGDNPLFADISFGLHESERIRLHGRNGAGKTTLIQSIMAQAHGTTAGSKRFAGTIATEKDLKIGLYEQEINPKYLPLPLSQALEQVLMDKDSPSSPQRIKQLLSDYLFNPASDGDMPVQRLSGGQKARFQLISMLADDPLVLILDEPTNHLDLPSIEELEHALTAYHGAIIYISHDSYFADKLGGKMIAIGD